MTTRFRRYEKTEERFLDDIPATTILKWVEGSEVRLAELDEVPSATDAEEFERRMLFAALATVETYMLACDRDLKAELAESMEPGTVLQIINPTTTEVCPGDAPVAEPNEREAVDLPELEIHPTPIMHETVAEAIGEITRAARVTEADAEPQLPGPDDG